MSDNTKAGLIDFSNLDADSEPVVKTNSNTPLDKLRKQNAAADEVERLITMCKNEEELLRLRNKIIDTDYGTMDKREMITTLDNYVLKKIDPIIKEAALLEKRQEESKNTWFGAVSIIVIGIIVSFFFPLALPIAIAIVVLGVIGNSGSAKKELASSENAAKIVAQYKSAGYPVE